MSGLPARCCTLEIEGEEQQRLVAMSKAVGNPLRFDILKFLLTHPGCITGELVAELPRAQSTISQHLRVLRDAGWIVGTIEGPATSYCLDDDAVAWYRATINRIL